MSDELKFSFSLADEMREYVALIAIELSGTFGISLEDAVSIMNSHWDGFVIDEDSLLGHEEPEYWARTIYQQYRSGGC